MMKRSHVEMGGRVHIQSGYGTPDTGNQRQKGTSQLYSVILAEQRF